MISHSRNNECKQYKFVIKMRNTDKCSWIRTRFAFIVGQDKLHRNQITVDITYNAVAREGNALCAAALCD